MKLIILKSIIEALQNSPAVQVRNLPWKHTFAVISDDCLVFGLFRVWYSERRGYYCIYMSEDTDRLACLASVGSAETCAEWIRLTFERGENV